ncbi:MAG: imidazole glycerol phosphate synthase subunit HisH [Flavobacteriaceae bacterium]|jgi:imidazole glycerol-phosphate synthase subunit HisH|nr:imidazole glycerol phosphate synthase subunit HisH [Candidatus Neomarinimicrobiota bacterium]MBT5772532.1 imidazole glycerol phosphate synthase subunit HisH [Flavobacteriaceae bacterium]MBT6448445.1 imidazole glycerol phosphate synthase subunit HisH [Flavobacteriaceae bacterium]
MIVIIDYGMGNIASVEKSIKNIGRDVIISNDINIISNASSIILPGVGSFKQGMENLIQRNLINVLTEEVIKKKKPFLGICLGMQLIMDKGYEPVETDGLGWIKGEVIPIENQKLPLPHLGWNNIYSNGVKEDNIDNNFFFIHSYHVTLNESVETTFVDYEFPIVASLKKDNIFATQFHPEKSQNAGLDLLNNFFTSHA